MRKDLYDRADNLDINDVGVGIELDLLLLGGSHARVWCVKDIVEFLELDKILVGTIFLGTNKSVEVDLLCGSWSQA